MQLGVRLMRHVQASGHVQEKLIDSMTDGLLEGTLTGNKLRKIYKSRRWEQFVGMWGDNLRVEQFSWGPVC